jgi:hypothetical protein
MLEALDANGTRTIVVETANRFARDLMVQEIGFAMLRARGINLIAADSPSSFLDDTPTARLIRQVLGAVSEFEKSDACCEARGAPAVIYVPTGLVVMALRNASGEAMVEMVCVPSPTP